MENGLVEEIFLYFLQYLSRFLTCCECCDLVTTNSLPPFPSHQKSRIASARGTSPYHLWGPGFIGKKQHHIHDLYLLSTSGWNEIKITTTPNFPERKSTDTLVFTTLEVSFLVWPNFFFAGFCLWILSADWFKLPRGHICAQSFAWTKKGANSIA